MHMTGLVLRMYSRFLSQNELNFQVEEISQGEEAGIKSVSLRVDSYRAYATLESERGVHRLAELALLIVIKEDIQALQVSM